MFAIGLEIFEKLSNTQGSWRNQQNGALCSKSTLGRRRNIRITMQYDLKAGKVCTLGRKECLRKTVVDLVFNVSALSLNETTGTKLFVNVDDDNII